MANEDLFKLRQGRIEFILAAVSDEGVDESMTRIFELAQRHDAEVDLMGGLAVITHGTSGTEAGPSGRRFLLVKALTQALGPKIKALHGSATGHSGFVGSSSAGGRFSIVIPGFSEARERLEAMSFGQVEELR